MDIPARSTPFALPRRLFLVLLLTGIFAAWQVFRISVAFSAQEILVQYQAQFSLGYLLVRSGVCLLLAAWLIVATLQRRRSAWLGYLCLSPVFWLWHWADRLLPQAQRPLDLWHLLFSLLILGIVLWILLSRRSRQYFQSARRINEP